MRTVWVWVFVVIWFLHLIMGAGAGFAALRLWPMRADKFTFRLMLYLHALMIDAISAIVLVFMARGVTLTWKFSITLFAATVLKDLVRLPLVVMLIKGFKDQSGE